MSARLEDLTRGASVNGLVPEGPVAVVDVQWFGSTAVEVTYKSPGGQLGHQLLYRDREPSLDVVAAGRPWSFDGDGGLLRLVSEAYRFRLAYLFDPMLAVHTSLVEPLPHQITAVYGAMLPRQPLRFLLADDPGSGKTIMAGLFIKELLLRGDLHRCLIVTPGSLVEQWQDELDQKFHLPFEILTNDKWESARTGNWFQENPLALCRLDKLSRDEDVQVKLQQTDWDLIIVDEAHKMSASFFSGEVKETKRYKLGKILAELCRHFLLLTATPHNGKEEDFQLFMALLDGDRFEGRFRDGVHVADTSDLMRRLVKEELLKFDGTPLFPERRAYPVRYPLSAGEARLYEEVTTYVREEFNRADALANEGRRGTVGFALTTLQRRLASSPEAIAQSLRRRRERLEKRLREEELLQRGAQAEIDATAGLPELSEDKLSDLDEAPDAEVEALEEEVVDRASAARTTAELRAEISTLQRLEQLAFQVRNSGTDRKWEELSSLLQDEHEMFDADGHRRKLVIFTEHRDTLSYLVQRIRSLLGRPGAVVEIHGGVGRDDRRKAQYSFTQDKDTLVLVATDAAGEGINLQRAHLMVNYDLPWNPNRLEQRFGRIHRIGQTEVCHLWNLVAYETREGEVFERLFEKLEEERKALGGQVFDVLGKITFENRPLRELLIEAIRYGDLPEVRDRLNKIVDQALDHDQLRMLLEDRALARDSMDTSKLQAIRQDMERADAERLQPHFVGSFFLEALRHLGGTVKERESGRFEVTHVPGVIRSRDRQIGRAAPMLQKYERIAFRKDLINVPGKPTAEFVCPGHPLLDAVVDLTLERHRDLLMRGGMLVDEDDPGTEARALVFLEHAVQDARPGGNGEHRIVSRRMQFVEIRKDGPVTAAGAAPYLDYRPMTAEERAVVDDRIDWGWLRSEIESQATSFAVQELVPRHFDEVRTAKESYVSKAQAAVKDRLTKEIAYWDHRAAQLRLQEDAGQIPRLNSAKARQRADDLQTRLEKRMRELAQERQVSPLPPVVVGAALVIPRGLLEPAQPPSSPNDQPAARETARIERMAMEAVFAAERELGFLPRDVSAEKRGWDIESQVPGTGALRFIEVKGRVVGATAVTVTRNEIMKGLNKPDAFILAVVQVEGEAVATRYVRQPFQREPDFGVTSVNYDLKGLLVRAEAPG